MDHQTLAELEDRDGFRARHIGPTAADRDVMLAFIGAKDIDDLVQQAVPASIRVAEPLALPAGRTEVEVLAELERWPERTRCSRP